MSMSQTGIKANPIHTSTETLNFQLAQPNSTPPTPALTTEEENGDSKKPDPEQTYLETEIDSYSGVEFTNKQSFPSSVRPPTPPKPTMRAFTFGSTNPFVASLDQTAHNNALYTTVSKPKIRPKVPPKPSPRDIEAKARETRNNSMRISTTSLLNTPGELTDTINKEEDDKNVMQRVSSLPNLAPLQLVQVGNSLQPTTDTQRHSTIGYGIINKMRANGSIRPLHMLNGCSKDVDYCDMIPESPPYMLPYGSENIYEDVKIIGTLPSLLPSQEQRPANVFVSDLLSKTPDGEYTAMTSPISDVNFTFKSISIYENLPAHLPSSRVGVYEDGDIDPIDLLEPPLQFSFSNSAGHSIIPESNRPPQDYEYKASRSQYYANIEDTSGLSPSSSFTGHSSSVASTVASSFQGIQVCYFPPSPPRESYGDFNTCGLPSVSTDRQMRPRSVSDFSTASHSSSNVSRQSSSRSTRSRIPVPVKYSPPGRIAVPEEPAPPLPPTPTPSPVPISKNKKKGNKQDMRLSPPSPPTGKGARWYEKLGCIQSDTIQPAEPYGVPGERKMSKSLSKEQRKSKFFVPVESNNSLSENPAQITNAD